MELIVSHCDWKSCSWYVSYKEEVDTWYHEGVDDSEDDIGLIHQLLVKFKYHSVG